MKRILGIRSRIPREESDLNRVAKLLKTTRTELPGRLNAEFKTHLVSPSAVDVLPSSLSNAGDGVFAKSSFNPGDPVCAYSGFIYTPPHLARLSRLSKKFQTYLQNAFSDESFEANLLEDGSPFSGQDFRDAQRIFTTKTSGIRRIGMYDGSILDYDGSRSAPTSEPSSGHGLLDDAGAFVNHPSPPFVPNVLKAEFVVEMKTLDPEHVEAFPVAYAEDPSTLVRLARWPFMGFQEERIRVILFLASTHIRKGEEIFIDYRYNPSVEHPAWYVPTKNTHEAAQRWESE